MTFGDATITPQEVIVKDLQALKVGDLSSSADQAKCFVLERNLAAILNDAQSLKLRTLITMTHSSGLAALILRIFPKRSSMANARRCTRTIRFGLTPPSKSYAGKVFKLHIPTNIQRTFQSIMRCCQES